MDFIDANSTALAHLFGVSDKYEHCADRAIYLTSWSIDRDFIDAASGRHENFLVKPHPHIKNRELLGVPQVDGGAPAEIVIPAIAAKTDVLTVYHHGSSAAHYLGKIPNIRWVHLKRTPFETRPVYEVL